MIKDVELTNVGKSIHVDMGMHQALKTKIENEHLGGHEITKCIISKVNDTACNVEFSALNSLNIMFENIQMRNKIRENIDLDTRIIIYSLKYFTRPFDKNNTEYIKPDTFQEIEVIIK
ncbi:MAG: hypothetical protein LKG19_01055 [Saprospiraceae bacterium]|jgi:hypothetical protein|nr:hypothetical protein [Saprospiraceae bacterium]